MKWVSTHYKPVRGFIFFYVSFILIVVIHIRLNENSFEYKTHTQEASISTSAQYVDVSSAPEQKTNIRLLFVGDIMLGRHVEKLTEVYGLSYPFSVLRQYITSFDYAIANFESAVPHTHVPTPSGTMRFSVPATTLMGMKNVGFDILSIANNHSFDYGDDGLRATRLSCIDADIVCVGDPTSVLYSDAQIIETGTGVRVGILPIHAVWSYPKESAQVALLKLSEKTDMQFVYVHWGNEYELTHSSKQEAFAHALIDAGADAIVGHHPHVVQDVGMYKGVPIFYSLGNFVFDQYFSDEVQEGAMLTVHLSASTTTFSVVGVESRSARSQPRLMLPDGQTRLLERIFLSISNDAGVNSHLGTIVTSHVP